MRGVILAFHHYYRDTLKRRKFWPEDRTGRSLSLVTVAVPLELKTIGPERMQALLVHHVIKSPDASTLYFISTGGGSGRV